MRVFVVSHEAKRSDVEKTTKQHSVGASCRTTSEFQWKALDATDLVPGSTAHDRFQEWVKAGVFLKLWQLGVERFDELKGIDWEWLSMDGAITKAPLGGEDTGRNPTERGKQGTKRSLLTEGHGVPIGLAVEGANRHDMKLGRETIENIVVVLCQG